MAARFEAIPAETAVKRGFSFSTGRQEAADGITKNRNDADWRGWQSLARYRPDGRDQAA